MKILKYWDGIVDLEFPVQMNESQKEKFLAFFKKINPSIEVINVKEMDKNVGERESHPRKWELPELALCITGMS